MAGGLVACGEGFGGGRAVAQTAEPTAQPPPRTKPSQPPASKSATTNAPAKFEIKAYNVEGNTLLPPHVVDEAVSPHTGEKVSFDDVRHAVSALTLAYRKRGYETVSVVVPPQKLTNSVLTVRVVEGKLVEVNVVKNNYFSKENVLRSLPSLRTNTVLNTKMLQPELDQANANSDRQIYPVIMPGPEPGTSVLNLRVKDQLPLHGRFEVNDSGTAGTPSLRLNASVQYLNLWQAEQQIGLQYGFSPQQYKASTPINQFYDVPLIDNYSLYYRIPFGGSADAAGASAPGQTFGYDEVNQRFVAPPTLARPDLTIYANRSYSDTALKLGPLNTVVKTSVISIESQPSGEDYTINEGVGARYSKPLPPMLGFNSTWSAALDFKYYNLTSYNTNNFFSTTVITNNGSAQSTTTKIGRGETPRTPVVEYMPLNFRWDGTRPDKWGSTTLDFSYSFNMAFLSGNQDFDTAAYSSNAKANYSVIDLGFSREFALPDNCSLLIKADGQAATSPLLSNEQFGMGGTAGVRGYFDGEAYGDAGWRFAVEPRSRVIDLGLVNGKYPVRVRFSAFTDYGQLNLVDQPNSKLDLWGAGCGMAGNIGSTIDFRLAVAWALLPGPHTGAGDGIAYFGLGAQF
jgi:hemolysin activation/secretion protein